MNRYKSLFLATTLTMASASHATFYEWAEIVNADGKGGEFVFNDGGSITFAVDPSLGRLFEVSTTDRVGIDLENHVGTHETGDVYIVTTDTLIDYTVTLDLTNYRGNIATDLVFGLDALGTAQNTDTQITFSSPLTLLSDLNGNALFDGTNLSAGSGGKNSGDFLFNEFASATTFSFDISSAGDRDGVVFGFAEASVPAPGILGLLAAAGLVGLIARRRAS